MTGQRVSTPPGVRNEKEKKVRGGDKRGRENESNIDIMGKGKSEQV